MVLLPYHYWYGYWSHYTVGDPHCMEMELDYIVGDPKCLAMEVDNT